MGVPFEIPNDINISGSVEGKVYTPEQDKPEDLIFNCLKKLKKGSECVERKEERREDNQPGHESMISWMSGVETQKIGGRGVRFVAVLAAAIFILSNAAAASNSYSTDQDLDINSTVVQRYWSPYGSLIDCRKTIHQHSCDGSHIRSCISDTAKQIWPVCTKNFIIPNFACPVVTFNLNNVVVEGYPNKCPNCPVMFYTLQDRLNAGEECFIPTATTTTPRLTTTDPQQNRATRMGTSVMLIGLCALVILLCRL